MLRPGERSAVDGRLFGCTQYPNRRSALCTLVITTISSFYKTRHWRLRLSIGVELSAQDSVGGRLWFEDRYPITLMVAPVFRRRSPDRFIREVFRRPEESLVSGVQWPLPLSSGA